MGGPLGGGTLGLPRVYFVLNGFAGVVCVAVMPFWCW